MAKPIFLYLDNNRIAQKRLENTFKEKADIIAAQSMAEAKEIIAELPEIACFFVEYQLKTKTGLHFARIIRGINKYDASPVFLLAPMINEMLAYKAMRVGVNECVSKLISILEFQKLVDKHLHVPYVKLILRPYYEINCIAWQKGTDFYQFCPDIQKVIQADSANAASGKMKIFLNDMINSGEKIDFDFIEIDSDLHRVIPPRK
ncbi:response regulator [bacterium]|nr:response regulator [bacterium]